MKKLFTPLEKATDKVGGGKDIDTDGGLMPPSAPLERNFLTGFTIIVIALISFIILKPAWTEEPGLQGIEFLIGFAEGKLEQKKDYHLATLFVDFDFNIKPLTKKINFNPPSLVQFQLEPFFSLATQPEDNLEAGVSFLFKLGLLPETWKFQPYIKGGAGMIYITQHTIEQSTQFNFIPSYAAGLHYFFKQDTALTLEYRYRHLSNASIKSPNSGIDVDFLIAGITRLF
ncbi:MAG: acyloxyacyl hydrolase [Candidatus Omnitrophota bacterium]